MKAVKFAAKSTEDKRDSIPDQLSDCDALAGREGLEVVAEFKDEAYSAYKGDRGPGLAAALAECERLAAEHGEAALIVQHSDRLARGDAKRAKHLVEYALWAIEHDVTIYPDQDPDTFRDLPTAANVGQRNYEDSARKSKAVKGGLRRSARTGKAHGGPRPYGYQYGTDLNDRGRLHVVPDEVRIVRRVFEEFVAGKSITAITRDLQRDGVRTVKGKVWHQVTVSQMLRNRRYVGQVEHGGEVYEGNHEAIVPAELFEQAQQLRAARPAKGRGRPTKGNHLFRRGLLRCASCGSAMVPSRDHGSEIYYCDGHGKLGKDYCAMPNLRRADVDTSVYEYFEKVGLDIEATRAQVAEARDRRLGDVRALLRDATREAQEAEAAYQRVQRDYQRGAIEADDWAEQRPQLIEERDAARAELERLQEQARDIEAWGDVRDAEAETLRRLAEIRGAIAGEVRDAEGIDAVRAALMRLFERFIVHVDFETKQGRIEAGVRHEAIRTVEGEEMTPVLRPTALALVAQNQSVGDATRCQKAKASTAVAAAQRAAQPTRSCGCI